MFIQYINNIRATACFLVILTHSAMPSDSHYGPFLALFSLISSPSSELFVTISASLLAPAKQSMFPFYKKRFGKLIGPFLFWSVVILTIDVIQKDITLNQFVTSLLLFPIKPVTGVYWFVYAICGLYLVIPLISPWLRNAKKSEFIFVIALWMITLLLPYLNLVFKNEVYSISGDYYFVLSYFGGFIGYLFMGVFLRQNPIVFSKKRTAAFIIFLLVIIGTIPFLIANFYFREFRPLTVDNLSFSSMLFVFACFIFFQNFKFDTLAPVFNTVAKYSYGIYLVHILVIRDFVWLFFENARFLHPIIEIPLIATLSLVLCLTLVMALSKLPFSKYFVGA